jgi:hypothetical protein
MALPANSKASVVAALGIGTFFTFLTKNRLFCRIFSIRIKTNTMLHFLKKNRTPKTLQNWKIPVTARYRCIDYGDSMQYVNEEAGHVLYFSVLTTTGRLLSSEEEVKMQPSVSRSEKGWDLKGARAGGKEMLVCLFSFRNETDEGLVKDLFANIVYVGK